MEENSEQEPIQEPKKKINKVGNNNLSKRSYKILISVIIVVSIVIIVGFIAWFLIPKYGESYLISGTDIKINITSNQLLYDTQEELLQYFGEEYSQYYSFAIVEKNNSKYELYGTQINKSEIEEYDINSLVKNDRDYVASILGEEITSPISEIKLGEKIFKTYNYKESSETSGDYIVGIYMADIGEQYLLIEFYAESDYEPAKINDIMAELFK